MLRKFQLFYPVVLLGWIFQPFSWALEPKVNPRDPSQTISYGNYLNEVVQNWSAQRFPGRKAGDQNPVLLQGIETAGNPYYIGLLQQMTIDSPLSRVEKILDDFEHYQELFPGFDDIHVVSRDGNQILTEWEQHIPLFFVPNVHYQILYTLDKPSQNRKVYRYRLKESKTLIANDGLIVLEKMDSIASSSSTSSPEKTRYSEIDFCDADWGIVKTLAPGRIWKDSVEGIYLSDLAIKLKSENPDWSYRKIEDESKKILNQFPVDEVIRKKIKFDTFVQQVSGKP